MDDVPWIRSVLIVLITLYVIFMGFSEYADGRKMGLYIVGFGLVGGAVFFALFVVRYQVVLDRAQDVLIKRQRSVFGYRERRFELAQVSHAEVEESKDSDGGKMFAPVLVLKDGTSGKRVRLVDYQTTGWGPPALVEEINAWLGVDVGARE